MRHPQPNHLRTGRYARGFLPHVRTEGRPYFVTFRLAGTLPQEILRQYQVERQALMAKAERDGHELSWMERKRLFELYSEKVEAYLDAGHGDCWLKEQGVAELIADALRFFDGQRYQLGAWVVMPNHVHAIVRPEGEYRLDEIIKSWKGFTGREANKLLSRTGDAFWERDYYDHVIRDDDEKAMLIRYIHDNPIKAGLCARPEDWRWSSASAVTPAF